ncbi:hypothetical protein FQR65_LT11781 [Abscondita terminalis]|nr:hypothetical protein FQR65_LT11781 [Abscondita terminalis]
MSDSVTSSPKWFYVALATAGGSLNAVCCGMHYGWTSPSLVKLQAAESPIQITNEQGSWIATSLFFGGIFGAIIWNLLSLKITKRMVVLATSIPFVVSWLLIAFVQSYPWFLVARTLAGISVSCAYCTIPLFLGEVSGSALRGLVISCFLLSVSLGSFFINILGSYVSIRSAALISLPFPLLSSCLFAFVPDSPYDLIQNKRPEDAKDSLKTFRGFDDDFEGIKTAVEQEVAGSYLDLFSVASYRQALIIVLGVTVIYQFTGYTAFKVYLQPIFLHIGGNEFAVALSSICFLIPIVFTSVSLGFVDCVGRKPLMIFACVITVIALIIFATVGYLSGANQQVFVYASTAALLVYVAVFSLGFDFAPTVLMGEVFPYFLKPFASTINEVNHCFLMMITTKLFQVLSDAFGMEAPFLLFAVCTIFAVILIIYFVPETKRRNLEEIQLLLKNTNKR